MFLFHIYSAVLIFDCFIVCAVCYKSISFKFFFYFYFWSGYYYLYNFNFLFYVKVLLLCCCCKLFHTFYIHIYLFILYTNFHHNKIFRFPLCHETLLFIHIDSCNNPFPYFFVFLIKKLPPPKYFIFVFMNFIDFFNLSQGVLFCLLYTENE